MNQELALLIQTIIIRNSDSAFDGILNEMIHETHLLKSSAIIVQISYGLNQRNFKNVLSWVLEEKFYFNHSLCCFALNN